MVKLPEDLWMVTGAAEEDALESSSLLSLFSSLKAIFSNLSCSVGGGLDALPLEAPESIEDAIELLLEGGSS